MFEWLPGIWNWGKEEIIFLDKNVKVIKVPDNFGLSKPHFAYFVMKDNKMITGKLKKGFLFHYETKAGAMYLARQLLAA